MTREQRDRVFDLQYKIALLLDKKCKFEGTKNKLARLFQIVTNLRTGTEFKKKQTPVYEL